MNLHAQTRLAAGLVGASALVAGPLATAADSATKTMVLKKVISFEHGHKVTTTTFMKDGKTYKRRQWVSKKNGKLMFHSYTYLVRGKKAAKASGSTTTQGNVATTMQRTCAPGDPGAATSAYETFWKHVQAGHLDESAGQQVQDILNVDNYVKIHTVLIQNMADPTVTDVAELPPALQELAQMFENHFYAAHLSTSPLDQVKQITTDPDGYMKLHTVLIENMGQPLLDWANKYAQGTPQTCSDTPAGGGTSSTPAPAPAASDQTVHISGMKFPAETDVAVGSKVTWINDDDVPHTVTSMHGGPLKSGNLDKGKSYSYTFSQAGTYMYVCDVHPDMQGEVVVK